MSNTFEFAERLGFSRPFEFKNNVLRRGFYFKQINYKNLVGAIKESKPKLLNDFDYEEFISKQKSRVEVKDRETEEIYVAEYLSDVPFMIKDENSAERNLLLYGELNKKIANVRTDIYISRINIDAKERKVEYSILFIYEGFDNIKNNSDKSDENRVAIKISTHFFNDYKEAYNYLGYKNAQIEEEVFNRFEMAFSKAENEPFDLAFLYNQAPNFLLQKRNMDLLWKDLDTLLGGFVLESKEKAIIKVLRALAIDESSIAEKSEKQKKQLKSKVDSFLYRLMNSKSVFEKLYNKLNNYGFGDNNFTILINTLYSFWKLSSFVDSNYDDNIKSYKGGLETLPYQTAKILGFYNNNFEFQFLNDDSRLKIKAIKEEVTFEKPSKYSRRPRRKVTLKELAIYNLFHPIKLAEIPKEGELIVPDKVIPAFFLKAMDDMNKWKNLEDGILLTVDLVTTATGVGNLYKLRHLRHLVKLKNVKPVTTLFKVKTAVSFVEVSAGTLNIMLTLTDSNSEFAQKLQQYLFWLELASLGTDVVVEKLLKKSAKDAIDESLKLLKKVDNKVEQNQIEETLEHLEKVFKNTFNSFEEAYKLRYKGRAPQDLVDEAKAFKLFGKGGSQTVKSVNSRVDNLIKTLSPKRLDKHVMVSGMTYVKEGKVSKTFTAHNFTRKIDGIDEVGEFSESTGKYLDEAGNITIFQKFLDEMHPTLKQRYDIHLEEVKKGLLASPEDIKRAAVPASHGEIRALNDLLAYIDPLGELGDEVFIDIIGYNRYLRSGANKIQPPCTHCNYLTTFIKYIGL